MSSRDKTDRVAVHKDVRTIHLQVSYRADYNRLPFWGTPEPLLVRRSKPAEVLLVIAARRQLIGYRAEAGAKGTGRIDNWRLVVAAVKRDARKLLFCHDCAWHLIVVRVNNQVRYIPL